VFGFSKHAFTQAVDGTAKKLDGSQCVVTIERRAASAEAA
jgi:hypothetical protein